MVIVNSRLREFPQKIERQERGRVMGIGVKNCRNMRKVFEVVIGQQYKKGNLEAELISRGLYEQYKRFHPERNFEVELTKWKGKSSLEIIKTFDKMTIIKFIKKDKDSEPEEVRVVAFREEITALISVIKRLSKRDERIRTKDLALEYCLEMGIDEDNRGEKLLDGSFRKNFYAWRGFHNKFTLMLGALAEEEFISYVGGKTKLLEKDISIQMVLPN